ncbi:hypothetical protein LTR53_014956 [Teratosphaeriaceae sp. CCFEE 6253]|nr:hypothetical protein LTR53_014956 [Teratosphaeriaceae sp. CCFEE 6253]
MDQSPKNTPAACPNEQFLFCAIDNTNGGVVNWQKVADIFGIKKGADSMRYTRMKKKFGAYPGAPASTLADGDNGADDHGDVETPKTTLAKKSPAKKTLTSKSTAYKKRKVADDAEDGGSKGEAVVKAEPEDGVDDEQLD